MEHPSLRGVARSVTCKMALQASQNRRDTVEKNSICSHRQQCSSLDKTPNQRRTPRGAQNVNGDNPWPGAVHGVDMEGFCLFFFIGKQKSCTSVSCLKAPNQGVVFLFLWFARGRVRPRPLPRNPSRASRNPQGPELL